MTKTTSQTKTVKAKTSTKKAASVGTKTPDKAVAKTAKKTNLLAELTQKKMEALKSGEAGKSFGKFKHKKDRNENNSNVGPSWGRRKGN